MNNNVAAAVRAYRRASTTVAPLKQVIMLYDGMLLYLNRAKCARSDERLDEELNALQRAAMIASCLMGILDDKRGGAVAGSLRQYYKGLIFQIVAIPRQQNALSRTESVLEQVMIMRSAWIEVEKTLSGDMTGQT